MFVGWGGAREFRTLVSGSAWRVLHCQISVLSCHPRTVVGFKVIGCNGLKGVGKPKQVWLPVSCVKIFPH